MELPHWESSWHIDGLPSPNNEVPAGKLHSFTCLLGVYLSPLLLNHQGNFVVFPRSHFLLEHFFQTHSIDLIRSQGFEALKSIDLRGAGSPIQVHVDAGDVVLCHYLLAHSIAPNSSANLRYALYYRIDAADGASEEERELPLTNMWLRMCLISR